MAVVILPLSGSDSHNRWTNRRGPRHILGDRLAGVAELNDEDATALRNVIDGLIAKSRLRTLASDVS